MTNDSDAHFALMAGDPGLLREAQDWLRRLASERRLPIIG